MNEFSRLSELLLDMEKSGDPHQEFFYLGGPMANTPQFNYPKFYASAETLRCNGYNLISPAEIPAPEVIERAWASPDGSYDTMGRTWKDFMEDTITIIGMPRCIGAIFLPEWRESNGCEIEVALLQGIGKPVYEFGYSTALPGAPQLTLLPPRRQEPLVWASSPGAVEHTFASTLRAQEADRQYARSIR